MEQFIQDLKFKNIFVRPLESNDLPYHTKYIKSSAKPMTDAIKQYIKFPKLRSEKWISTSVNQNNMTKELLYASAEYFANNLINPVNFYPKLKELPSDAIVIEIGPHSVFGKIVTDTLERVSYMCLIKKNSNETNLDNVLKTIANLYELGLNPNIENLYPKVEWPVARNTQSINSLLKWDHNTRMNYPKYPEYYCRRTASDMYLNINLMHQENAFYLDHVIDGNAIFPAAGYILLAWRHFANHHDRHWWQIPVTFENVQFKRVVILSESVQTQLKVEYLESTDKTFRLL